MKLSLTINKDAGMPRPCWWCGAIKTNMFMARALQKPGQRPFVDMVPCPACTRMGNRGILVVCVSDESFDSYSALPQQERLYTTVARRPGAVVFPQRPPILQASGEQQWVLWPERAWDQLPVDKYLFQRENWPGAALASMAPGHRLEVDGRYVVAHTDKGFYGASQIAYGQTPDKQKQYVQIQLPKELS